MWCWYGTNISTVLGYKWAPGASLQSAPSASIEVLGDGNQEYQTNSACRVWNSSSGFAFNVTEFPNVEHFSMTLNSRVLSALISLIHTL